MALTSPPATAHPAAVAAAQSPRWISSTSWKLVVEGAHSVADAPHRGGPHAGEVGEGDGQRASPEPARRDPPSPEIDALHQGVLADSEVVPRLRRPDRRIVARPDRQAARRGPRDLGECLEQGRARRRPRGSGPPASKARSAVRSASNVTRPQYTWRARGVRWPANVRLALGPPGSLRCGGDVPTEPRSGAGGREHGGRLF